MAKAGKRQIAARALISRRLAKVDEGLRNGFWRRGRDSNPRYACTYSAFRVRRDRPLCHLSGAVDDRSHVAGWVGAPLSMGRGRSQGATVARQPPVSIASIASRAIVGAAFPYGRARSGSEE